MFMYQFLKFGQTVYQKYGPLPKGWLTVIPIIGVLEPKYLQVILSNSKLSEKNFFYSFMHTFLGQGLITSNGHKWKTHRRYISQFFKTNYLEQFIQTFDDSAKLMIEQLKNEKEVKITKFVNRCILNILHNTIMGIPISEQETINKSPFSKGEISLLERILRPWLLLNFIYRFTTTAKSESGQKSTLKAYASKVLEKRRRDKEENKTSDWCLLDGFIEISETKPDFTDDDIVDEVCTFMLAGQDSAGAATAFTLYHLAKYEQIQEKVVKEIRENLFSSDITIKTLDSMKYLQQCIYESLRLCPSVPLIARRLSEDVKLDEYVLPEGSNIFISPFATHRLPHYYPDPETFDPERFSTGNSNYAYIPFSAGPRDCLGKKFAILEMKVIISRLLQNYKISLLPEKDELVFQYRVTLRAKGGITLKLENR